MNRPPTIAARHNSEHANMLAPDGLRRLGALTAAIGLFVVATAAGDISAHPRIRVTLDRAIGAGPMSGRLLVFMTDNPKPVDTIGPAFGEDAKHVWIVAKEIHDLAPGESTELDASDPASPEPLWNAPAGDYQAMALLDVDHSVAYSQFSSFEWVFSPRGPDGRPLQLFSRHSGAIDRTVAAYWLEHFDIRRVLTTNASQLVPRLRSKIHIVVGTEDTFFVDRAVRLLQKDIVPLGYQAHFTFLEGRNHFDLYKGGLITQIATQMYAVARPSAKWKPRVAPLPATKLD